MTKNNNPVKSILSGEPVPGDPAEAWQILTATKTY